MLPNPGPPDSPIDAAVARATPIVAPSDLSDEDGNRARVGFRSPEWWRAAERRHRTGRRGRTHPLSRHFKIQSCVCLRGGGLQVLTPGCGYATQPMPNEHKELWCLLNWAIPSCLGELKDFQQFYERPIKQGQKSDASIVAIGEGTRRMEKLQASARGACRSRLLGPSRVAWQPTSALTQWLTQCDRAGCGSGEGG